LTGNVPPIMYIRQVEYFEAKSQPKRTNFYQRWLYKRRGESIPEVYGWKMDCQVSDKGYLHQNDWVEIYGISYRVTKAIHVLGLSKVTFVTMSVEHKTFPTYPKVHFEDAQILWRGNMLPEG
jgi:hypothetical protein